jgi:protein pelota
VRLQFTLEKDEWDKIALHIVDNACNPANRADVAAVTMNEGLANICLITSSMSILVARVETSIPRKRKASAAQHDNVCIQLPAHLITSHTD